MKDERTYCNFENCDKELSIDEMKNPLMVKIPSKFGDYKEEKHFCAPHREIMETKEKKECCQPKK